MIVLYRPFDFGVVYGGAMPGLFWFRLFGRGLHVKDVHVHPLTFSQRTTWLPIFSLGKWQVRWLKK